MNSKLSFSSILAFHVYLVCWLTKKHGYGSCFQVLMDPEVLQWENWSFWGPTILTDSHDKDEGVAFSPAELLQDWISFEFI